MRAMWMGFAAAIIIAVIAGIVVTSTGDSASERYSTANTRL